MLLNDRLRAWREARMTAERRAAYDEFLSRLDAGEIARGALAAGKAMPAFLLPNAEGRLIASDALLAEGPVVLTFVRGDWCPYCSMTLDALEAALPELTGAGGRLAAITPETGGRALAMRRAHGLGFEVLVDVDLAVAMAFGVVFRTPPRYRRLLEKAGIDLAARSGHPAWFLPIPATFLVGRDGIVRRAWVDPDFTRRAEPGAVVAALRELRKGGLRDQA